MEALRRGDIGDAEVRNVQLEEELQQAWEDCRRYRKERDALAALLRQRDG
jgi:hypothetical protein